MCWNRKAVALFPCRTLLQGQEPFFHLHSWKCVNETDELNLSSLICCWVKIIQMSQAEKYSLEMNRVKDRMDGAYLRDCTFQIAHTRNFPLDETQHNTWNCSCRFFFRVGFTIWWSVFWPHSFCLFLRNRPSFWIEGQIPAAWAPLSLPKKTTKTWGGLNFASLVFMIHYINNITLCEWSHHCVLYFIWIL